MRRVAIAVLVVFAGVTLAQEQEQKNGTAPTIDVPERIAAKVGRLFAVEVKSNCKELTWEMVGNIGADGVPLQADVFREYTDPAVFRLRIICYGQGVYHLTIAGALGDKVAQKRSVILSGEAQASGADLLTKSVQAAFLKDADPAKWKHAAALARVFGEAEPIVNNPNLKTSAEVEAALAVKEGAALGEKKLLGVRHAIRAELNWTLGPESVPLTPKVRTSLQAAYGRIEAALKSLESVK